MQVSLAEKRRETPPLSKSRLADVAFAFRGYNVTNLGRTPELLTHPAYGPIVEAHLRDASEVFAQIVKRPVDLVERARAGRESRGLEDYAQDVALIVAAEMAQVRLLEEFFGIALAKGRLAFGSSVGECTALAAAGVFAMKDILGVALAVSEDCARLTQEVSLGVLIARGPALDFEAARRLCMEISQEGRGTIDISTHLSPNSLLLFGQNGTLKRFEAAMSGVFPDKVFLRQKQNQLPPLHTPIMWQLCVPDRAARLLEVIPGGFRAPSLPILSMVTGKASYRTHNSRELLHRWVHQPQRLWDVVCQVLATGVQTVVHVGPAPSLLPASFHRLSNHIKDQLSGWNFHSLGRRALARLARRPWLTRLLPSSTLLLRAPYLEHVILEDWLLRQTV